MLISIFLLNIGAQSVMTMVTSMIYSLLLCFVNCSVFISRTEYNIYLGNIKWENPILIGQKNIKKAI